MRAFSDRTRVARGFRGIGSPPALLQRARPKFSNKRQLTKQFLISCSVTAWLCPTPDRSGGGGVPGSLHPDSLAIHDGRGAHLRARRVAQGGGRGTGRQKADRSDAAGFRPERLNAPPQELPLPVIPPRSHQQSDRQNRAYDVHEERDARIAGREVAHHQHLVNVAYSVAE